MESKQLDFIGMFREQGIELEPLYDYVIHTDGAYSQAHDEGAFALIICNAHGEVYKRGAWKIQHESNNRAELKAIIAAIHFLPPDARTVLVRSDSQYALNTLSGKWRRNANTDLFNVYDRVTATRELDIRWQWVKGHDGDPYNELCDTMCNECLGYDANAEYAKYRRG